MTSGTSDAIAYHETLAAGWTGRYASGGFRRRAEFFRADVLPQLAPRRRMARRRLRQRRVQPHAGRGAGAQVLGLDGSPAMVEAARAASRARRAQFEVGRVEDVGALGRSLRRRHLPQRARICARARAGAAAPSPARLKPGGRLAISAAQPRLDVAARAARAASVRRGGGLRGARLSRQFPAPVDAAPSLRRWPRRRG